MSAIDSSYLMPYGQSECYLTTLSCASRPEKATITTRQASFVSHLFLRLLARPCRWKRPALFRCRAKMLSIGRGPHDSEAPLILGCCISGQKKARASPAQNRHNPCNVVKSARSRRLPRISSGPRFKIWRVRETTVSPRGSVSILVSRLIRH